MSEPKRCTCSSLMYRNNHDGKRDYHVKGKTGCLKCRGYGYIQTCEKCGGAGLVSSAKCSECWGTGVVPVKG